MKSKKKLTSEQIRAIKIKTNKDIDVNGKNVSKQQKNWNWYQREGKQKILKDMNVNPYDIRKYTHYHTGEIVDGKAKYGDYTYGELPNHVRKAIDSHKF